jgi:hypothetical protein
MNRVVVAVVAAVVVLAGCSSGPPSKVRFAGQSYKRGVIATDHGRQSFLYTIPEQGAAQNSRLGMITSTTETPEELQTWIMKEYVSAMGAGRILEQTPTQATACKVGSYQGRDFVAIHVCGKSGGRTGCFELDEKVSKIDPARAADLCVEWRGKYEAELEGLLPLILANG